MTLPPFYAPFKWLASRKKTVPFQGFLFALARTSTRNVNTLTDLYKICTFIREPQYRCLVPFTAFCEPHFEDKSLALFSEGRAEIAFFAGFWRPWHGERLKVVVEGKNRKRIEDDWELFSFLTTEPNAVVEPIHKKAMPVILQSTDECQEWLSGDEESLKLQESILEQKIVMNN